MRRSIYLGILLITGVLIGGFLSTYPNALQTLAFNWRFYAYAGNTAQIMSSRVYNPEIFIPVVSGNHQVVFSLQSRHILDIEDVEISCGSNFHLLSQKFNKNSLHSYYQFSLTPHCEELSIKVYASGKEIYSMTPPLTNYGDWISTLTDLPDERIASGKVSILAFLEANQDRFSGKFHAEPGIIQAFNSFMRQKYRVFEKIESTRLYPRYLIPVEVSEVPTDLNKIPNAARPYRNAYTDGIHHGWDFYAPLGSDVRSVADGVIIHVRSDFTWENFTEIDYTPDTHEDNHTNLDTLRGNQIWLKTFSGDVWMYSHLGDVSEEIQVGSVVSRGQYFGTIGVTGIPFENYDNYHLHIPMMINPKTPDKVGKNSLLDIMQWNWYGKNNTTPWILENQKTLFSQF